MGIDTRRPVLPAPTESIVDTLSGSVTGTDLATDISRRTDKTSYSIPDDGTPITISTRRKHRVRGDDSKLSRSAHHSQTSLLIEYFEGGKGSGSVVSRPSVRVRVTPSSAKKSKDPSIHITESSGNRRPVYSRRISFGSPSKHKSLGEAGGDDQSYSSSPSATDENLLAGHPVEIELMNREQTSELSSLSREHRYNLPNSDISSMPADSMLEAPFSGPRRKRSQSLERQRSDESKGYLKTPTRQRSRSLSAERIVQRAAEKVSNYPRETVSGKRNRPEKSKGVSGDYQDSDLKSPRRRVRDDEMASPDSSILSASVISSHRRSGDQNSFRSNTSKASLNNPKLLETVEDAIRRLILPELKELKKDQKVISNTSKFERDLNASYSSASPPSRDELGRRLSKHASAPDVRKPQIVLNKDSHDDGIILANDMPQKERRTSRDSEMTNETEYISRLRPELTEQDKIRRQRSKGLREAEKAAIVGNRLTAANLKHHESRSSLDKNEDRRDFEPRGVNETELVFQKHNVAPMPLRSAIESDLMTRDSILSERTAEPATTQDNFKLSNPYRSSPTAGTPNRTPLGSRYDLGLKHSNLSNHNLSIHSSSDHGRRELSHSPLGDSAASEIAAAAAANLLDVHTDSHDANFDDHLHPRRALSPIQSVASNQSESHIKQDSTQHYPQEDSEDEKEVEPRLSIDSLSSAPSTSLARSKRPDGFSVASQTEVIKNQKVAGPELGYEDSSVFSPLSARERQWLDEESEDEGAAYRESMAETASIDAHRMTGYTEDSELDYNEKVNEGRPIAEGIGANPQFVHPAAVESAVASLLDPSHLTSQSNQSGANRSQLNVIQQQVLGSARSLEQVNDVTNSSRQGSPLKQRQDASSPDATSFPRRMGATSPPQSVTQSLEDPLDPAHLFTDQPDDTGSPLPQGHDRAPDSESEINTNPSIIQGPIGGVAHESNWPYSQTPPKGGPSPLYDKVGTVAASAGLGLAAGDQATYNQDYYPSTGYNANNYMDQPYNARGPVFSTPPGAKDEGYMSAANPLSPSPEPGTKGFGAIDTNGLSLFDSPAGDDQFGTSHHRHFSGYSHGVGSPLYDSATGKGIDRIQSKDIVALMDHLTVRDAQRNARDTEILVTLVRSAAEMRNSFEEMKKFIALQDGLLQESNDRQHERTHKALGGPRPLPVSGSRTRQAATDEGEDLRSKRKNVFKRALKGLSLKSSNDLSKIEEMLEQLLEEVEALRAGQDDIFARSGNRGPPSVDFDGYEPEGHAGTSSPGDHSGYLSTSSRPVPENRGNGLRRDLDNRVSTVPEADEEEDDIDERAEFLSPQLQSQDSPDARQERAGSAPVSTPPRGAVASGALSNETTPKTNEKARKHKSSSSSFFPKISRWSKTTASSMGDNIRNSIQPGRSKERTSFDASRSGSDIQGNYKTTDYYDPHGDDRIRSNFTLNESPQQQENRPPSPLVPSQVSEAPKYRAHRDSLDLQHPQPRQGPTGRYQSQLETQAQIYTAPVVGTHSDQWGSNPSFSALNGNRRLSGGSRLSPISDAGYSETSSRTGRHGPPRPPKVKDDGPLFPERPPKVKEGDEQSYAERVASRSSAMGSPHNTPPTRKPTGPRPLNSGSQYNSPSRRKRSQYRESPQQSDDEHDQ